MMRLISALLEESPFLQSQDFAARMNFFSTPSPFPRNEDGRRSASDFLQIVQDPNELIAVDERIKKQLASLGIIEEEAVNLFCHYLFNCH